VAEETTQDFEYQSGQAKLRTWVDWHWKNDPVLRLTYRYE
jgi:hypothetical protein